MLMYFIFKYQAYEYTYTFKIPKYFNIFILDSSVI